MNIIVNQLLDMIDDYVGSSATSCDRLESYNFKCKTFEQIHKDHPSISYTLFEPNWKAFSLITAYKTWESIHNESEIDDETPSIISETSNTTVTSVHQG